jgi:hypothetical protein
VMNTLCGRLMLLLDMDRSSTIRLHSTDTASKQIQISAAL